MRSLRSWTTWAAAVGLALSGCYLDRSEPTDPSGFQRPSFTISDAVHAGGNRHFFFLPPLVPQPNATGAFDGSLSPVVEVCEWSTSCGAIVARFTMQSGTGGSTIRVTPPLYQVDWDTKVCVAGPCTLDPAKTYRVTVLVAGTQLGFADVDVVANGSQLKNVQTNEFIGLVNGRTLPVKFRIEVGAVGVVGIAGGTVTLEGGVVGLTFPAAAVAGEIGITTDRVESAAYPSDTSVLPGTLFEFQPSPISFTAPVTLVLKYSSPVPAGVNESKLVLCKVTTIRCLPVPGGTRDLQAHTVSGPIGGFSEYGVTEQPDEFDFVYSVGIASGNPNQIRRLTGTNDRLLYEGPAGENFDRLEWSADGTELKFDKFDRWGGGYMVYSIPADGGARTLLATDAAYSSLSPAGRKLAYYSGSNPTLFSVKDLNTGTTNSVDLSAHQLYGGEEPRWSPDGKYLAIRVGSPMGVVIVDAVTLTLTSFPIGDDLEHDYYTRLTWAPDSRRLVVDAWTNCCGRRQPTVFDVNGTRLAQLIDDMEFLTYKEADYVQGWSPVSEQILLSAPDRDHNNLSRLFTVNADGSNLLAISPDSLHLGFIYPYNESVAKAWSPDGRWVLFSADGTYRMRPDGTDLTKLNQGGPLLIWNPTLKRLP